MAELIAVGRNGRRSPAIGWTALACWLTLTLTGGVIAAEAPTAGETDGQADDARERRLVIQTGWDLPNTAWLRRHAEAFDAGPFDGVVLRIEGRRGDDVAHLRYAFSRGKWDLAWFDAAVEDLQACDFEKLRHNFALINANPGDVDWFDDEGWADIVDHFRIAATVARRGGLRGLLFDPEPYNPPYRPFTYAAQLHRREKTFDQYAAKARQRGREVMAAIAEAWPDAVLLCYFVNSINLEATSHEPFPLPLQDLPYGLAAAFFDGWLDAAPPTIAIVDGCEDAYLFNSELDFYRTSARIRIGGAELISPENRAKYRAQVEVGFGLYLDAHANPPGSPWHIDPKGASPTQRFGANLNAAFDAADRYVWLYGERHRWWPVSSPGAFRGTWEDALPGLTQAITASKSPTPSPEPENIVALRQALAERTPPDAANLFADGDFAAEPEGPAAPTGRSYPDWRRGDPTPGWGVWQRGDSTGLVTRDPEVNNGAARLAGVAHGHISQTIPDVTPGETFAVRATMRQVGAGRAWAEVYWRDAEGQWLYDRTTRLTLTPRTRDGWRDWLGMPVVPEGAASMVVTLGVSQQGGPDDRLWIDDVHVARASPADEP